MSSKTRGNYSFSKCLDTCECPKCVRETRDRDERSRLETVKEIACAELATHYLEKDR